VIISVLYSLVFYVIASATAGLAAPRYAVPAAFVLALVFASVLSSQLPASGSPPTNTADERWRRPLIYGIAGIMAVGWVLAFPTVRSGGSSWVDSVRTAAQKCAMDADSVIRVDISPQGWSAMIPCPKAQG